MSDSAEKRVIPQKRTRSRQSKALIAASLLVSACIIGWTFSLPFRLASSASQNQRERAEQAEQIHQKRTRAEEIREEAFANHQHFVSQMVKKRVSTQAKPGRLESRRHWDNRVAKVKKQLLELGNPEADTLQWHQKQDLLDSLEDGPL